MAAYINTNISSLFAQKTLSSSQNQMQVSLQRLSSGMRINSAKDDATGLVNGTKLDSQVRGSNQAIRNANDGISSAQTNDGYLAQITENLQRMRELAVQSGGTLVLADSEEGTALVAENDRILAMVNPTGNVVVDADGGLSAGVVGVAPVLGTAYAVTNLDDDLDAVGSSRAKYGADMATFESAINNLQTSSVNLSAAKSRIMDTDYAAESAQLTRNSILQQAGTAMLAQANQLPNTVLKLLQ